MKQSKLITVPIKARSSKKHPEVHLAYITDKEQDLLIKKDLYNSLKGKPNRGPGGLPSLEGDFGSPTGKTYEPAGPDVSSHRATGEGGQKYTKTKSTVSTGDHTGKVISAIGHATNINPLKAIGSAITWGKSLFTPKTEQQKVEANIAKGYDVNNPAEMHRATQSRVYHGPQGNGGGGNVTTVTRSLVTAPTADKSFGHQWDFKAYDNQQATTTPNVYDYSKAPYAKKGKMIYKYGTGQEVKKRSLPPSKGPDSKGLPSILENSDYFTKLIGE